jgi:hypothetical protein
MSNLLQKCYPPDRRKLRQLRLLVLYQWKRSIDAVENRQSTRMWQYTHYTWSEITFASYRYKITPALHATHLNRLTVRTTNYQRL